MQLLWKTAYGSLEKDWVNIYCIYLWWHKWHSSKGFGLLFNWWAWDNSCRITLFHSTTWHQPFAHQLLLFGVLEVKTHSPLSSHHHRSLHTKKACLPLQPRCYFATGCWIPLPATCRYGILSCQLIQESPQYKSTVSCDSWPTEYSYRWFSERRRCQSHWYILYCLSKECVLWTLPWKTVSWLSPYRKSFLTFPPFWATDLQYFAKAIPASSCHLVYAIIMTSFKKPSQQPMKTSSMCPCHHVHLESWVIRECSLVNKLSPLQP